MSDFPRTTVDGLSVSRMILGTNWFLGYAHSTPAKSTFVERTVTSRDKIADTLEVFLAAGVDPIMCPHTITVIPEAVEEARQRAGRELIVVSTPSFPTTPRTPFDGFDTGEVARILDAEIAKHVRICMPHSRLGVTADPLQSHADGSVGGAVRA